MTEFILKKINQVKDTPAKFNLTVGQSFLGVDLDGTLKLMEVQKHLDITGKETLKFPLNLYKLVTNVKIVL